MNVLALHITLYLVARLSAGCVEERYQRRRLEVIMGSGYLEHERVYALRAWIWGSGGPGSNGA
jgi:hypothetical protein